MGDWIKKMLCFHLNWKEGRFDGKCHPDDYVIIIGVGQMIPHTCKKCGKVKRFPESSPPISFGN